MSMTQARQKADAASVREALEKAQSLVLHFDRDKYAVRSIQESFAAISLLDYDSLLAATEELSRSDPEQFPELYGYFIGSLSGLQRALVAIEERVASGRLDTSSEAPLELLRERLTSLQYALDQLGKRSDQRLAEEQIRSNLKDFGLELEDLRNQARDAATEFGLDIKQLDWGVHADAEAASAMHWRRLSVASLIATTALSALAVLNVFGDTESWPDLALKLATTLSLAALSAYAASQARDHRLESRKARHKALDLRTLTLFVAGLDSDSRDVILTAFGLTQFNSTSSSANGAELGAGASLAEVEALDKLVERLGGLAIRRVP